ncbi:MAG: hypothetical protein J3Q66DRAFT_57466 [Benniella sp.]|nr:MAG: hypothetical protein J3Q66DRAFT_57466 [Benniella sp.]
MSSPLARSASTLSTVDMTAVYDKMLEDQNTQLGMLKATRRAMDKSLSRDGPDSGTVSTASLSFEILGELLDEIILDVASEAHRDAKCMRSTCPICKTKCRNYVVRAGQDIFGQNPQSNSTPSYDCVHCGRSFPPQRYAPHLEKCLGLAGRSSSRTASRRMGAGERAGSGSPFTPLSYSDDREASDSDKDLMEKKRKKNASNSNGYASGSNGTGGGSGGDYDTPASIKLTSPGSIKIKKQKQAEASDYPAKTQKVKQHENSLILFHEHQQRDDKKKKDTLYPHLHLQKKIYPSNTNKRRTEANRSISNGWMGTSTRTHMCVWWLWS